LWEGRLSSAHQGTRFDLAIIGGGVNGCGIARDAAGRGASVVLFEQNDLAGGTSSRSTKLIHGGLRYLEFYEFRLVRDALKERDVLWHLAPHIVSPRRFVLPHHGGMRSRWLLRLGLFLYDHIGGRRQLPGTRWLDLARDVAGEPLKPAYRHAFEYSDCSVDDARLVVLNARDAAQRGAVIRPRTRVTTASRLNDHWQVGVENHDGRAETIAARILINAAGPWVGEVATSVIQADTTAPVRLVQGSHIVVPKLFSHEKCYIFQNSDARIVFALPFEQDFTLIGTTDRDYRGDPAAVCAGDEEIAYLCSVASEYFRAPVRSEDVVWAYSGVRPLHDDGSTKAQEATRDYTLTFDANEGQAALLSVLGGKITTYRVLAELAVNRLKGHLAAADQPNWTERVPLPGGDFPHDGLEALVGATLRAHPYLARSLALRLVRAYGTQVARVLGDARAMSDLGTIFGADLTEREAAYLMREEWAQTAEDVLWRRSKLGLRFSHEQTVALENFMQHASTAQSLQDERRRAG
jgi:glycerol-3-phosphate dehydrogenase